MQLILDLTGQPQLMEEQPYGVQVEQVEVTVVMQLEVEDHQVEETEVMDIMDHPTVKPQQEVMDQVEDHQDMVDTITECGVEQVAMELSFSIMFHHNIYY